MTVSRRLITTTAWMAIVFAVSATAPPGSATLTGDADAHGTSSRSGPTPRAGWETIGYSVLSRPIHAITIGDGDHRVFILGGIHGDEDAGVRRADDLARHLEAHAPADVTIRFVADANPDGTAAGTRWNNRDVDLNRNWPSTDFTRGSNHGNRPLSEPETRAVHADLTVYEPDLVIAVHEAREGPFANFDGEARDHASRFAGAARDHDLRWHVEPDLWWPTPGSLGTWLGADKGIPVLTVEFLRGTRPDAARPILFDGIDAVLLGVVREGAEAP